MTKSIQLGEVKGNKESSALCVALFNLQGVNAFRLAQGNNDTEFTYGIYTEQKLRKDRQSAAITFVEGFKAGLGVYF